MTFFPCQMTADSQDIISISAQSLTIDKLYLVLLNMITCEISVIQAALSYLVGATRWTVVSWPNLTLSIWILKSRLWYSILPDPPPPPSPPPLAVLRSLMLLVLLMLEHSEESEMRIIFNFVLIERNGFNEMTPHRDHFMPLDQHTSGYKTHLHQFSLRHLGPLSEII